MRPLRPVDTRPGHVYFDHGTVRGKNRLTDADEDAIVKVGFLNLDEPRSVHDLLLRPGAEPG